MTIHSSDVKLFESQRLTHEEDGSGRDTGKDSKQKRDRHFLNRGRNLRVTFFFFFFS